MEFKKNSAWYNLDLIPGEMVKGAKAELQGFKKLEESDHFVILDKLIKNVNPLSICDMGCGAGEISRVYNDLNYLGLDLPHIIERVAMVVNPGKKYMGFDANTQKDLAFLNQYQLLVMNGFLSELPDPLELIAGVLSQYKGSVIIHRQDLTDSTSFLEEYLSYGGLKTTNSQIQNIKLKDTCEKNGYEISLVENSGIDGSEKKSLLLKFKK